LARGRESPTGHAPTLHHPRCTPPCGHHVFMMDGRERTRRSIAKGGGGWRASGRRLPPGASCAATAVVALGGGVVGRQQRVSRRLGCTTRGDRVSCRAPTRARRRVDAAIGGKTAVKPPRRQEPGRWFHKPVACSRPPRTLADSSGSLKFAAGLGEVRKVRLMPAVSGSRLSCARGRPRCSGVIRGALCWWRAWMR